MTKLEKAADDMQYEIIKNLEMKLVEINKIIDNPKTVFTDDCNEDFYVGYAHGIAMAMGIAQTTKLEKID